MLPLTGCTVGPAGLAAHRQGQAAAAMVEELHSELRAALSSTRFTEAVRAGVQHTFRQLAEHVYLAAFAPKPAGAASQAGALTSQGGGLSAELSGQNAGSTGASEISAADSQSSSPEPTKSTQTSTSAAAEPQESFTVRLSTSLLSLMGLSGSAPAAGPPSPSKPAPALIQHDPVPVARLLKPVQSAADPLFADVRQVTKVSMVIGWIGHLQTWITAVLIIVVPTSHCLGLLQCRALRTSQRSLHSPPVYLRAQSCPAQWQVPGQICCTGCSVGAEVLMLSFCDESPPVVPMLIQNRCMSSSGGSCCTQVHSLLQHWWYQSRWFILQIVVGMLQAKATLVWAPCHRRPRYLMFANCLGYKAKLEAYDWLLDGES
jgi:hypothetical protein